MTALRHFANAAASHLGATWRSSVAWAVLPLVSLAALGVFAVTGMLAVTSPLSPLLTIIILLCCSAVSATRAKWWSKYDRLSAAPRHAICVLLGCAIVIGAALLVELPYSTYLGVGVPSYLWLQILLCGLLMATLFFVGQRHASATLPAVAFFAFTGVAQHYVRLFKNAAILPTDLLVLSTASAVAGEYEFTVDDQLLLGMRALALVVCALSLVKPPAKEHMPQRTTRNLATGLGCGAALTALMLVPNYMTQLGIEMRYWFTIDCYQEQGFYPSFIAVAQDMPIRKPEGYTDAEAIELTKEHADEWGTHAAKDSARTQAASQFERKKPSVVVVMNESFCDMSLYDNMHAGYDGPSFFKTGFGDAISRGTLNVSVHGGGTCNSEFEFLTGNSLSFIGAGKYPYSLYDLTDVDALPAQFAAMGYRTTAIHPHYPSNWRREVIYPLMGFDQFLNVWDFGGFPETETSPQTPYEPHSAVYHSAVSDAATYERVLDILREDDRPQFVFDVTMANHGSYDQNNLPSEYQQHYQPADAPPDQSTDELNEFLGCIAKADDDLKAFVGELRKLNRPVVLVFFGDHQPAISLAYNDAWYLNEPEDVHARRAYSTGYVIWANYDVAGRDQKGTDDELSLDLLAAQALSLMGAPLSDYQAAKLDIRQQITSLATLGYQTPDRTWHTAEEQDEAAEAYRDLSFIEYLNFATKV